MAIKMDFSSSRGALQRLSQFLQYDQLNKRASARQMEEYRLTDALVRGRQREGFQQDIAKEAYSQENRLGLEDTRSKNQMAEDDNKTRNLIMAMPEADGIIARLNMWRKNGVPKGEEDWYKQSVDLFTTVYEKMGVAVKNIGMGLGTEEDLANIARWGGSKFLDSAMGVHARSFEAAKKLPNETMAANTAANREEKTYPDWFKNQNTMIDDAMNYVKSNRITMPPGSLPSFNELLGGAGLTRLASLPEDLHGALLQGLMKIRQDISAGGVIKQMTEGQNRYVREAMNSNFLLNGTLSSPSPTDKTIPQKPGAAPIGQSSNLGNLIDPDTNMRPVDNQTYKENARRASILMVRNQMLEEMSYVSPEEIAWYKESKTLNDPNDPIKWARASQDIKDRMRSIEIRLNYSPTQEDIDMVTKEATNYVDDPEFGLSISEKYNKPTGLKR